MSEVRVILRFNGDSQDLTRQAAAATLAIDSGMEPGGIWGVTVDGRLYGVKRNKAGSVSVWPSSSPRSSSADRGTR